MHRVRKPLIQRWQHSIFNQTEGVYKDTFRYKATVPLCLWGLHSFLPDLVQTVRPIFEWLFALLMGKCIEIWTVYYPQRKRPSQALGVCDNAHVAFNPLWVWNLCSYTLSNFYTSWSLWIQLYELFFRMDTAKYASHSTYRRSLEDSTPLISSAWNLTARLKSWWESQGGKPRPLKFVWLRLELMLHVAQLLDQVCEGDSPLGLLVPAPAHQLINLETRKRLLVFC